MPSAVLRRARFARFKSPTLQSIEGMAADSWLEITGSNLSAVSAPDIGSPTGTRDGGVFSFSGTTYDSLNKRVLMFGGGHADYAGNETYAMYLTDLRPDAWRWQQVSPAHVWATELNAGDLTEIGTPTKPVSRHTYGYCVYSNETDRFISMGGGALFSGGSHGDDAIWELDPSAGTWAKATATLATDDRQNAWAVRQARNGKIWTWRVGTDQPITSWDPVADTKVDHGGTRSSSAPNTAAYRDGGKDTQEIWVINDGDLLTWDLNDPDSAPTTVSQTSAPYTTGHGAHGFDWHPGDDRFVSWPGAAVINTLNPNGTWTVQTPTGDTPGTSASNRTYNSFFYIPHLDRFGAVSGVSANLFLYRVPSSY